MSRIQNILVYLKQYAVQLVIDAFIMIYLRDRFTQCDIPFFTSYLNHLYNLKGPFMNES